MFRITLGRRRNRRAALELETRQLQHVQFGGEGSSRSSAGVPMLPPTTVLRSGRIQDRAEHRCDGALAVRAGDGDDRSRALGDEQVDVARRLRGRRRPASASNARNRGRRPATRRCAESSSGRRARRRRHARAHRASTSRICSAMPGGRSRVSANSAAMPRAAKWRAHDTPVTPMPMTSTVGSVDPARISRSNSIDDTTINVSSGSTARPAPGSP